VFCGIVADSVPAFTVAREPDGVAFLDTRPVFPGHVLVVPPFHVVTLPDLPADFLRGYFGILVQHELDGDDGNTFSGCRTQIVDAAVGMVEHALKMLQERNVVELDGERKAAMVSNLLVVLCGHTTPQPVLNTGTLYN